MRLEAQSVSLDSITTDLLAVPVPEGATFPGQSLAKIDRALDRQLSRRAREMNFKGREGDLLVHPVSGGALPSRSIALFGVGKVSRSDTDVWRRYGASVRMEARRQGAETVASAVGAGRGTATVVATAEGFLLGGYRFDRYKSQPDERPDPKALTLVTAGRVAGASRDLERAQVVAQEVFRVRDLVNEPAAVKTPSYLAEIAAKVAKASGLAIEVYKGKRLEKEKLAGLLAVARGSNELPRFIILRYKPQGRPRKRVALVGKGLTFDSGGLSLKPPKSMETMKLDMAGGATVIATMGALGKLRPKVEVTAYVPATENLPGGSAQKPGDVIRYMNGKTVEVLNTDAEGRLILADALALASRSKPHVIIDLATLTGACMVALGTRVAGIMGNDHALVRKLIGCGNDAGESLWELPLVEQYREDIKSPVADIKNTGGPYGGTITAGLFLKEFVDGAAWAHLDIAGPSFAERDLPYTPRGGTGFGVRTLVEFLTSL